MIPHENDMKRILHAGCGPSHVPEEFAGWQEVRLDCDPSVKPDIVASIVAMPMVESDSFDAVYNAHCLEHLYAHEVPLALSEFFRVLKPNGYALIATPDLQRACAIIAWGEIDCILYHSEAGPITAHDMIFGHRQSIAMGRHYMAHRTGFTADSLTRLLQDAGFIVLEKKSCTRQGDASLWITARKPHHAPL